MSMLATFRAYMVRPHTGNIAPGDSPTLSLPSLELTMTARMPSSKTTVFALMAISAGLLAGCATDATESDEDSSGTSESAFTVADRLGLPYGGDIRVVSGGFFS